MILRQLSRPHRPARRKRSRGANLLLLCATAMMLIGFMAVAIYTGLQAYMENELQRITAMAAQVGASAYYGSTGPYGQPVENQTNAQTVATQVFNSTLAASSLGNAAFGFKVLSTNSNPSNDSITVTSQGTIPTGFLAPLGVASIQLNATATARALRYEPTRFTGPIMIQPVPGNAGTYSATINLQFPLVDNPGADLYVEQVQTYQKAYVIEACNDTQCYDLTRGATIVGNAATIPENNPAVWDRLIGTAVIDIGKAGVRKATRLRITYGNDERVFNKGLPVVYPPLSPIVINRIMLFGFAGNCVSAARCPVPAGFAPVE